MTERIKLQRRLRQLWMAHIPGRCWVCSLQFGGKRSPEAFGRRCPKCFSEGKTNAAVKKYELLVAQLAKLDTQKS